MDKFFINDYDELKQIIEKNFISSAVNDSSIDLIKFVQRMEIDFARFGFRNNHQRDIENILIICLDEVGDFILTSPTIRAIRENFPAAYITLVVTKKIYQLAEFCPYVNEVLIFEREYKFLFDMIYSTIEFAGKNLWKRRYDKCFYLGFVRRHVRGFITYLSGAKERIGFDINNVQKFFFTKYILPSIKDGVHESTVNLSLLNGIGLKVNTTNLEIWYSKRDFIAAKNLLGNFGEGRIKIAVGIGAGNPSRKYPIEKYVVAFKEIIDKGAALVILGGSSEVDDAKFLEDNLPKEFVKNVVNVDWRVTAALISLLDMYIGNDTGTLHISSVLKKPVIYLSRVAKDIEETCPDAVDETKRYAPFQTNFIVLRPDHQLEECRANPIYTGCNVDEPHCITQIEPAEIVNAYDEMLRKILKA